jgi:hypothetical protein
MLGCIIFYIFDKLNIYYYFFPKLCYIYVYHMLVLCKFFTYPHIHWTLLIWIRPFDALVSYFLRGAGVHVWLHVSI